MNERTDDSRQANKVSGTSRGGIPGAIVSKLPAVIALALLLGAVELGRRMDWKIPNASKMLGYQAPEEDDWCVEHAVEESICIECKGIKNAPREWCSLHGVAVCPHCNPKVAQVVTTPKVTDADRAIAKAALEFAERTENNKRCPLPDRRLQLSSEQMIEKLGLSLEKVARGSVAETIEAPAELSYSPSMVARVSSPAAGLVVESFVEIGESVRAGDILAIIDAAEVGKAKSEWTHARIAEELNETLLSKLRETSASVPGSQIAKAEAYFEESRVRTILAEQSLANLGLPIESLKNVPADQRADRLRTLGLPSYLSGIRGGPPSSNLLAIRAMKDGKIISRSAAVGEMVAAQQTMFTVADSSKLWLTIKVRGENIDRIKVGQKVAFAHEGHEDTDHAKVAWISPICDEKSRTVEVRALFDNSESKHRANEFGTAKIVIREAQQAIIVPSDAIHWDGDCNVVFVKNREFGKDPSTNYFHVRQVRPASRDVVGGRMMTEIAAGVLPGEMIAVANSGILRSELLKNNLGAGCGCHGH